MKTIKTMKTIKNPETYIKYIEDKDGYLNDITVEHRSNNPKRDFLFVNKKQCKHIPCSPSEMIEMCEELARLVNKRLLLRRDYNDLNVLVIGFAETATAIGTIVGDKVYAASYILHTTREEVDGSIEAITFEETHSHATTQKLLVSPDNFNFSDYNYILFVEDEISTGNTILNFINAFEEQHNLDENRHKIRDIKYGVASICNWQDMKMRKLFRVADIDTFSLISGELKDVSIKMFDEEEAKLVNTELKETPGSVMYSEVNCDLNTFFENRTGHIVNRCIDNDDILNSLREVYHSYDKYKSIRVIGTEECMEMAIKIGKYFEDRGHEVVCHATTRSKIDVLDSHFDGEEDGIKSRYKVPSAYEECRDTYIYNMNEHYELILLVTDSTNKKCIDTLVDSLVEICSEGTQHIGVVRL